MIIGNFSAFRRIFSPGGGIGNHGYELWDPSLMRAGGFTTLTWGQKPLTTLPVDLTVVGHGLDAAPWVDEYDWYLSQKTDDPALRRLQLMPKDRTEAFMTDHYPNTASGQVLLDFTEVGRALYGGLTIADQVELFRDVYVYVRRISDGAIQMLNVTNYLFAELS